MIQDYGNDHGFYLVRQDNLRYRVYGNSRNDGKGWAYNGYAVTSTYGTGHLAASTPEPSDAASLANGLAMNNPSRPSLDLPREIIENVRDLPHSIAEKFRYVVNKKGSSTLSLVKELPRSTAKSYLEWQFSLLPLYRSLEKLMQFKILMDKRVTMLKALRDTGSVHRTGTVWRDTSVGSPSTSYLTGLYSESNQVQTRYRTERRKWVATKYWIKTGSTPLPDNDKDLMALAVRLTYGLDFSFTQVWDLMPWTWLFDWFGNVGDVLNAYNNHLPVTHEGSCIMVHSVTGLEILSITGSQSQAASAVSDFGRKYEEKVRTLAGPTPPLAFSVPFLTAQSASILGAIIGTRRSR